jgi:hypothetical protein
MSYAQSKYRISVQAGRYISIIGEDLVDKFEISTLRNLAAGVGCVLYISLYRSDGILIARETTKNIFSDRKPRSFQNDTSVGQSKPDPKGGWLWLLSSLVTDSLFVCETAGPVGARTPQNFKKSKFPLVQMAVG